MAWGPPPHFPPLSPVTVECVLDAAKAQRIPLAGLVAIMAAEGGQVGRVAQNSNGTWDIGPGQINSSWLTRLAVHQVSEGVLLNNGCVNVLSAAWIFKQALIEKNGDVWAAIGRYHSCRGTLALDYQRRVYRLLSCKLNVKDVVDRANRGLGIGVR
jgi:hypothetical protein